MDLLESLQRLGDAEHDDIGIAHDALSEIVRLRLLVAEQKGALYGLRAEVESMREEAMARGAVNRELRTEVEALRQDAERFCALFSHMDESGESPWSAIESVKYGERIDAGEPLIDVIREAIDKHLRGEEEK